jgi:hypothetical protein
MKCFHELCDRTLRSVLSLTVALFAFTGVALAQVPSAAPPPFQASTFMAGFNFAPPTTGAGDLFCITGSATRLTKLKSIQLNGIVTGAAITPAFNLIKRSTLDTVGTPTTQQGLPLDSTQTVSTATATVKSYTAVPTPGTPVGTTGIISTRYLTLNLATAGPTDDLSWAWTPTNLNSDLRLRSATESLCLNTASTLGAGPGLSVELMWTEQ